MHEWMHSVWGVKHSQVKPFLYSLLRWVHVVKYRGIAAMFN